MSTKTLAVKLGSTTIPKSHKTKLKFAKAAFYIDKGIKHTHKKRVTYAPNATAHHVPAALALALKGVKSGTHTLTIVVSYGETVIKHHHKQTKTVTKKLTMKFKVC